MLKEKLEVSDLATKLKKSKQEIYEMFEKEDVNTSLLRELSSIFNVSISEFFEDNIVEQNVKGNSNILVGRDNNGNITTKACKDQLDDALLEIKYLKGEIEGKDKLIREKERLINIFMDYGSIKNNPPSITVFTTTGPSKIDILKITNIIPCTGKEKEFVDKINSGSAHEYPCCKICLGKRILPVLQDSGYIWNLITDKLSLTYK